MVRVIAPRTRKAQKPGKGSLSCDWADPKTGVEAYVNPCFHISEHSELRGNCQVKPEKAKPPITVERRPQ